jgi:hypothetical protein
LKQERVEPHVLLDDAMALHSVTPPQADVMFALVDPFGLDSVLWASVSEPLARFARNVNDAIIEVFAFDRRNDVIAWPTPPPGFMGPVATTSRRPYHLAAYTTSGIAEASGRSCAALGWDIRPTAFDANVDGHGSVVNTSLDKPQTRTAAFSASIDSNRLIGAESDKSNAPAGDAGRRIRARGFSSLGNLDDGRLLETIGLAEERLADDIRASLIHQRRFVERIVHLAARDSGLDLSGTTDAVERIKALESHLGLNHLVVGSMHWLRLRGNEAAHGFDTPLDPNRGCEGLLHCHNVARWFMARGGHGDLEPFGLEIVPFEGVRDRQLRRRETQTRRLETLDRITRQQKIEIQELRRLLEQRLGGTQPTSLGQTVPDTERLRWVYFATPTKANRSDTYNLAYSHGVVCCDAKNSANSFMPNVKHMRSGDLMLLAYGEGGQYEPQLYLKIELPTASPIAGTAVMHELPRELAPLLERAGYHPDPVLGVFTGFQVTPCSDWKGRIPESLRKPVGQNFIRTWNEVRSENSLG